MKKNRADENKTRAEENLMPIAFNFCGHQF